MNPTERARTTPELLTVAYIAMGAKDYLVGSSKAPPSRWFEGELDFIDHVIRHALMLDNKADEVDASGGFTVCFLYEIAEPFGEEAARRLAEEGRFDPRDAETLADYLIETAH